MKRAGWLRHPALFFATFTTIENRAVFFSDHRGLTT